MISEQILGLNVARLILWKIGSKPSGLANPDLKWETSEQVDLGLDARFLNDRLTLGLDWYRKTTKDLLIEITPIPEIGVNKRVVNTGKVLNSGLDFELGWRDHIKGEVKGEVKRNDVMASKVLNISKRKNTYSDRTDLIMTYSNEFTTTGKHSHNVALLYALIHCLDSTREDPWMKTLERFFLTFL